MGIIKEYFVAVVATDDLLQLVLAQLCKLLIQGFDLFFEGVAVEYVSCEPIPEVTYTPDISAEARKEYAERVMAKHKEKAEQA